MTTESFLRQWIDEDRTVLVSQYEDGVMEVAFRDRAGDIWGPPVSVELIVDRLPE